MTSWRARPAGQRAAPGAARLRAMLLLGAIAPVLVFCALASYALVQSRAQYEQRAELLTQNLASAIDRGVSANVEKIDLALASVVDHLEQQLAVGPLDLRKARAHLQSQSTHRVELEGLRVTDREGIGILGPGIEGRPPLSFADREWFTVQRDREDAGLYMSLPLVSKISGAWIVSFSRRYRGPDGRFAGGVSAAVPLDYFAQQLAAIDVGPHGLVTLRSTDLGMIAQHPAQPAGPASGVGSRQVSGEFEVLVGAGGAQGTLHERGAGDGHARTVTFRRLGVAPLLVMVGLAAEDYLPDWYAELRTAIAVCTALAALHGAGVLTLSRMLARNREARQRIDLLAKVFEHSGEAIVLTDARNAIIEVNPAFTRQTGYAPEDVIGRNPSVLASGRTPASVYESMWSAVRAAGLWRGELWDRKKDGQEYPTWISIAAVRDADGLTTHHIASAVDMTEVKRAEAQILHLAEHDALTRLPNRVFLHGRLEQAILSARRAGEQVAMLFIDMDRFKNINDTLGHHVGDGLLVQVGERLRDLVRENDIIARLGGDEFVLLLTGVGAHAAAAAGTVANKVLDALGRPYFVHGHELHSTPSIGIGIFPTDGDDADTLMKNADAAMYHAKSAGRNNFQFFTRAMNQASAERLALEVGLRSAIKRQQLFLNYQPQLDLRSGRIVGVEALVRWRHPELGLVPPLKFIPVAEDSGQIEAIGTWVLDAALAQIATWRAAGNAELRVAVNLSAQQLRGNGLADLVGQALQRHGLPGQALEIEITESTAMRDPTRTAALLRQLRDQGVALAIDDFGTGYSSLAYLKQLPLSCLKLDRSFVMDIERDPNDAAICTASIQMAHSLGLAVVAEGVETATQLKFLRGLGCDLVQGYHISRPLSVADCGQFLRTEEPVS
jgi:diguanylate cyclase (GGDEF)-like protein/PAS domain S-box-containing protein